jgi:acyl-coenzyme A synthetase/AMP-(fatty) acid ligase
MSAIETVYERMKGYGERPALFADGKEISYTQVFELVDSWEARLASYGIERGSVCGLVGEFSLVTCPIMFALMRMGAILVPFTKSIKNEIQGFIEIAGVEYLIHADEASSQRVERLNPGAVNPLIARFRETGKPGLVVFTSGSTGVPKGILHDCERVMRKFVVERQGWRSVLFLLMDHFGGFNTFLAAFANGGTAICVPDRTPAAVCQAIAEGRANLLPTTPTFINLLLASGVFRNYDLNSVELITYGTEVMPETTLARLRGAFPNAVTKQTYGLSELGVLRSRSESDASLWVKLGGDGFEVKVVDNILWVRSEANMVGYLNAPSPFDADGWMCTGDEVEVRGEYMRVLGRKSDMINVGGAVLLEAHNIREAAVFGVKHPIMGSVVHARISLYEDEGTDEVVERLRKHCLGKLAKYKVPIRFSVVSHESQHNERFKKIRKDSDPQLVEGGA